MFHQVDVLFRRTPPDYEVDAIIASLRGLFKCDTGNLPVELLGHSFFPQFPRNSTSDYRYSLSGYSYIAESSFPIWYRFNFSKNVVLNKKYLKQRRLNIRFYQKRIIGETGYGCHTFYITDVFRNIVITADIRLLLCLNIVSCAHINMQLVIFTS